MIPSRAAARWCLTLLLLLAAAPAPDPVQVRTAGAVRAEQAAEATRLAATTNLRSTEDALAAAETEVAALDGQAAELDRQVARQSAALEPLLAFAVRRATAPRLGLLVHPAPPREAARGLLVIEFLGAALRDRAVALAGAEAALVTARQEAAARRDAVVALRETRRAEAAALDAQLAQARTVRLAATAELADSQRRAAEAAHAASLDAAVATVIAPAVAAATPHTGWVVPVAGARVGAFGAATDAGPATGIRFAAPPAARVVAPCNGRVAYAAPFRSYGGLIILGCADGMHATLSGLDRIDLQVGQPVRAGAPAGTMPRWDADHPPANRPALMLQALRDGNPIDPAALLH